MINEPIAADLAVQLTRRYASSARPDAPVVPDRAPRHLRLVGTRTRLAAELRAVAGRIEPSTHPANASQAG